MAVARSSIGSVAIRYVLPVYSWMTLCLHISARNRRLRLPRVRYSTVPFGGFVVQGPIDNFTPNWTSESPVFYPVFILTLLEYLNGTAFNNI